MPNIKKLEIELDNGRIVIEKWEHDDRQYETVEMFGCLDLVDVEKAIAIYRGKEDA